MAVKPVEYIKDSSTPGFAKAGDEKTITSNNANTIKKDADLGNTKDLDNFQSNFLENRVDYDTLDYSEEEMEKVGEQQIDTEGEDGESLEEKDQKGGAVAASVGASVGAAAAAAVAIITATTGAKSAAAIGKHIPGGMLAAGIVATVGAGVALACSFEGTFDPNLVERKNQTGSAPDNNSIIQQYIDTLSSDTGLMEEDMASYTALSEMQTNAQVETITELGALQAELQVYQSQGNSSKVAELKAQMEEIKKTSEEENKGPQEEMDGLKENIETYTGNNAEATGVKTSGDTVSEFLKQGDQMKNFANAAKIASQLGAAAMLLGVAAAAMRIGKDLAGIFTAMFAGVDGAGMAMFVAGGVMMGVAANNFGKHADAEGAAASAGEEMAGNLATLQENIDGQAGYTESTSSSYSESDATATETIAENQEAANNANKGGVQGQGQGQKTTTKPEENQPGNQQGNVAA